MHRDTVHQGHNLCRVAELQSLNWDIVWGVTGFSGNLSVMGVACCRPKAVKCPHLCVISQSPAFSSLNMSGKRFEVRIVSLTFGESCFLFVFFVNCYLNRFSFCGSQYPTHVCRHAIPTLHHCFFQQPFTISIFKNWFTSPTP